MADTQSASLAPFLSGTLAFFLVAVISVTINSVLGCMKRNPYDSLINVMIITAMICMYILWAVTWLMQWHPIVSPMFDAHE
eukprot:g79855.t1